MINHDIITVEQFMKLMQFWGILASKLKNFFTNIWWNI